MSEQKMLVSAGSQVVLVWWGIAFTTIYALAVAFLLRIVPPPSPTWSAERVAEFYQQNSGSILLGAVLTTITGAFLIPIAIVAGLQSARLEAGRPVWSLLMVIGGVVTSIFLVFPPLFFGVAAFRPHRPAEITAIMHDLALLGLFSTVQFYIFFGVSIAVTCLRTSSVQDSPFSRLYGYFTIWCTMMFEVGGVTFLFKSGPFAWNGLFIFYIPFFFFFIWLVLLCVLLLRALSAQIRHQSYRSEDGQGVQPLAQNSS
jgi:hypothetical protein